MADIDTRIERLTSELDDSTRDLSPLEYIEVLEGIINFAECAVQCVREEVEASGRREA